MMMTVSEPGTNIAAHDQAVKAELWISFCSLLRSHLGALQITGRLAQATFVNLESSTVEVVDLLRTLRITSPSDGGQGAWSLTRKGAASEEGTFVLNPDASVVVDGVPEPDMELAVEAFAKKLWARTQTDPKIVRRDG